MKKTNLRYDLQVGNLINNLNLDIELDETTYFREKFECLENFANVYDFSNLPDDLNEKYKNIKTYYKENIDLTQKIGKKFLEKNKEKILESI